MKRKMSIVLALLALVGVAIFVTPGALNKVKSIPLRVLYTYNVTKSFTEQSEEIKEVTAVPMGEVKNVKDVYHTNIKIEGAPRYIKNVVAESLREPREFGGKSTLTGPDEGFKVRVFYRTKHYDKGEYTVTRTNRLTGKEKAYTGTYYEPSAEEPLVNWSRDYK